MPINDLKRIYLQKSLSLVLSELELTHLRISHPESFRSSLLFSEPYPSASAVSAPRPSSLSLIPKYPNLGIMGMTELLTALSLLGGIDDSAGNSPATVTLAEAFEQTFDFRFNNVYDRQCELFKRKPYNLTKTLDALKAVLTKEYKRREAKAGGLNDKDGKR